MLKTSKCILNVLPNSCDIFVHWGSSQVQTNSRNRFWFR